MIRLNSGYVSSKELFSKGRYVLYTSLLEKVVFLLFYLRIARTLPANDYGLVVSIFAFFNILASVFDFGLPAYFQRESAVNIILKRRLAASLQLKSLMFLIYIFCGLLYFKPVFGEEFRTIVIIGITAYLFGINDLFMKILYGRNLFKESFRRMSLSRILGLLLLVLLFYLDAELNYLLGAITLMPVIQMLFLIRALRVKPLYLLSKLDLKLIMKILKSAIPMGLGAIFVWGYNKSDILLIQQILNLESVALYSAAYSVYQMPQILSGMILAPLYSRLSKKYTDGRESKLSLDWMEVRLLLMIGLSSVLVLILYADEILIFLFGEYFIKAAPILKLLSIAVLPLYLNNYTGVVLNSCGSEKLQMTGTFSGLIFNIAVNIIFIKSFGLIGAVISTIATETLVLTIQAYFLLKTRK